METNNRTPDWIQAAKARRLGGALRVVLITLQPMGIFSAQMLYILQPTLGAFVSRQTLTEIAQALETPKGVESLLQHLED